MRRYLIICVLMLVATKMFALAPTGTLPVVYISTSNGVPVSRETAVSGTLYVAGQGNYPSLGSAQEPIPLTIKGRGNWTWWGFDKKPYKIVFAQGQGQKLLGMKKSKHWALLAGADDYLGFLKNTTGYLLSEQIGLPYTPHQVPVELVLNGDYMGLYFVTETVRVDNDRVNIHEQQDGESDAQKVTGGWLVEIDNYDKEGNISFTEYNGTYVMVTPQSPEDLSVAQRAYITEQFGALNDAIYGEGAVLLWDILDLDDAVKFYLVQEIMEDCESYHGSCFLYKDRDSLYSGVAITPKWHFGPVWDFGNAYDRQQGRFIYDHPTFSQVWAEQLANDPVFHQRLLQYWYQFRHHGEPKVKAGISAFVAQIASAAQRDEQRWREMNVRTNGDMNARKSEFLSRMNNRLNWLYEQWGDGDSTPIADALGSPVQAPQEEVRKMVRNGEIVIVRGEKMYTVTGMELAGDR